MVDLSFQRRLESRKGHSPKKLDSSLRWNDRHFYIELTLASGGQSMSNVKSCKDLYDLHLHTYWSYDATAHPENYFKRAREIGVQCLAIADHHILDSLEEVLEIAQDYPDVRTIPSAELSVTTSIGTVDLLCYGFPTRLSEELKDLLEIYHQWQRSNGAAISEGLQALGHDFTHAHRLELLSSYRPSKAIKLQGNTHVKNGVLQEYVVERGFVDSEDQYAKLMAQARKAASFPPYPDASKVVPVVKRAGVLIAIAHPYGYFKGHDISRMDTLRKECRLDGIECINKGLIPPDFTRLYREYCVQHGLFSVAGSDCHSDEDIPGILAHHEGFACYDGSDKWLDEFLDRLDNR